MNYKRIGFIFGVLLLILMSACGPATATPIVRVPTGLAPTSPVVLAPTGLAPACNPDALSIPTVTSFCANQAAGLGGATVVGPGIVNDGLFVDKTANWQCNYPTDDKFVCSGPQNSKSQWLQYDACGFPNSLQPFGDYQCANGMIKTSVGCSPDPKTGFQSFCTETSHYDTGLQACVDNVTGKPIPATDLCPPGYPYYLLDGYCLAQPYPGIVYNVQYTTVQLGSCLVRRVPGIPASRLRMDVLYYHHIGIRLRVVAKNDYMKNPPSHIM